MSILFDEHREVVQPEWIDYNGHMNVAFYFLAFDHATDAFYDAMGCGEHYKAAGNFSTFTLEGHITYDQEVLEGDPLRFTTQLLDFDEKRLHYFHVMYHAEKGFAAATNELIAMHVDMDLRRSAPFPPDILKKLADTKERHGALPRPDQAGRIIGIRRKSGA